MILFRPHTGLLVCLGLVLGCSPQNKQEPEPPNVLILYADDLGYGDLSSYGGEIRTPHLDRLAKEGMRFTHAYATSATCTPSRYGLLTGVYPWRESRARVLPGNAPLIIDPETHTLADLFRSSGYRTAVIGKWHLGLGADTLDWNGLIRPGPNDLGFDESFILASTNDRVPTVYVENDRVFGLDPADPLQVHYRENFEGEPTGAKNPELLKLRPSHGHDMSIHNGISRIGYMKGGKRALWQDETMGDTLLQRALGFIKKNKANPFFLFLSFPQLHVPRTPHPRFEGVTGKGPRGDALAEMDAMVGAVMDSLQAWGLDSNTLILFSSDNGPVLDDGYEDQAAELVGTHKPAGPYRGGKYSLFEAGTRVPFIAYWKGVVPRGQSEALISQVDLMASLGEVIGKPSRPRDSEPLGDALLGRSHTGRKNLILEAMGRRAYRRGNWALIPPYPGAAITPWGPDIELANGDDYQLYDLNSDPGQTRNLAGTLPDTLQILRREYEALIN
ncbi:sulfatase family protein [Robiginitalea sediminis]|uniref:sulfatase family protein n=1 Tax=Robiginitalea sediminis TaxID=1982593 RepID=UPI000B4AB157|nr:arylsulfatase [Robiginitalea sediminis]